MTNPRGAGSRVLLASLAAILAAAPAQAAGDAHLLLSVTGIEVPAGTTLAGHALALGVNAGQERPGGWEFRADHVRIDTHHDQGTRAPGVIALNDGQPIDDGQDFGPAFGYTTAVGSQSYLTATAAAAASAPLAAATTWPALPLAAVPAVHFANQASSGLPVAVPPGVIPDLPFAPANRPAVSLDQPAVEAKGIQQGAPVVLRGDLAVFAYAFNFTIKPDAGDAHAYVTGLNEASLAMGRAGRYDDGRATLVLTNATFTYRPGAAAYQLDLADATLGLAGSLLLHNAQGRLDDGGQATALAATTLTLDFAAGSGTVRPAAATGDARMDGEFLGSLRQYVVDGRAVAPAPASAVASGLPAVRGWAAPAAILLTIAAVAALALAVRRRRRGVDFLILEAEEAFMGGRFERALAVSARAVRRAPTDMDAVVLRCLARLRLGEPARAAEEIDGILGSARPLGDPGTLHLLLSMCRMESGEDEGAQQALAQALSIRPDLGEEVRRSPLFRRVLDKPELRALLGQDPAASYYA